MITVNIESMKKEHTEEVVNMMRTFYTSPAVHTNGSEEIYRADVENCINDNPYIEGYVFVEGDEVAGYGMLAKSFSTEFGKNCIWLEDIYLKPEHCNKGYGTEFLHFVEEKYPDAVLRLESEEENERAVHVYKKFGFEELPYIELKK